MQGLQGETSSFIRLGEENKVAFGHMNLFEL